MSRRELLRRSGIGVVAIGVAPAVFAGCGGGGKPDAPQASGEVDFLWWEGYDLPKETKAWRDANHVTFNPTYIANNDDIPAKLKSGGGSYDLTGYSQSYKQAWAGLGIIAPFDSSKVPNLANQFEYFNSDIEEFWVDDDGTRTGVPFTWGSVGITWDDAALPGGLGSYYDLLDLKFAEKIGVPDDGPSNLVLAARMLGYDVTTLTKEQKQELVDLLAKFVKQAKVISPTYGDMATLFASGEIVACFSGWAALNSFAAGAGKKTVKTKLPKEGGYSFCDAYTIPSTADNADAAYAFINEALRPEVNAAAAEALVGGVTVEDAVPLLSPGIASLYPYDDLDSLLEQAPFFKLPPFESDQYVTYAEWADAWQELKAGA